MGDHTLVLNASFEPLSIISWQRAIQLLFLGKVEVIEESEREIRTVRFTIKAPAVLRMLSYIPIAKKRQIIRFSRANVFIRDQYQCQYCADVLPRQQLTLDHVVPSVQGGEKNWHNIVTSCKDCNQRKGGRTPAQANMHLIRKPREPRWLPSSQLNFSISFMPDRWKTYLYIDTEV
ncbi:MAG: HNH endonuclease [Bacteriovoracia bacterium]